MMKLKNKKQLLQDNIKYSDQIGILVPERPRVVFSRKEINELDDKRRDPYQHRAATPGTLGRCLYNIRTIYVAERTRGAYIHKKFRMRKRGWYRWKKLPWNYPQQREVLVHELVHYRFPELSHGRKFEQRIKEILRGMTFPPKHTHLFAGHSKARKQYIDGDPVEPEKEYDGTLDYFL